MLLSRFETLSVLQMDKSYIVRDELSFIRKTILSSHSIKLKTQKIFHHQLKECSEK